ncbi:hypothetical protein EWM64_g7148 [Hericium alpestre]|uniref:Uncharacterized protein n=1 Tax=Hericium alpestre TaxID=135208 RepID=A0A4Y9ZRH5_9AGAM|nr:hypothetical protein EWM64_g7148 [Hericium alpestre]
MAIFGINSAFLFAAWGSGILWGIFTCAITYALYILRRAHVKSGGHRSLYISGVTIIVLYLLATIYLCFGVFQVYVGFIQTSPDQQIDYFFDNSGGVNQAKNFIYLFSMWISDGVVVWRCFAIWNHDKRVITIPVLLLCMAIASGLIGESQFLVPVPSIANAGNWGTALYAVSLTLNAGTTLLTAGRLWYLTSLSALQNDKMKRYRIIILATIDSAVAMAAARIIEFVLFLISPDGPVGNNAFYTVTDLMPQICGIVPTAIVVVVYSRRGAIETYHESIAGPHSVAFQPRHMATTDTNDLEHSSSGLITMQTETGDLKSGHLRIATTSVADTKQG